jgi:nitrite reductase/ring-hydroxylating ferredoxin subunit
VAALALDALADQRPTRVDLGHSPPRGRRQRLFAISECSTRRPPKVRFSGSLATVTCPVHGSQFALDSGKVLRGPATTPVAAYDVRVNDGVVQIRDRA